MSNMSYCRFQNTSKDLDDCQTAVEDLIQGDSGPLSREELEAAGRLIESCANIISLLADHAIGHDIDTLMDRPHLLKAILQQANSNATATEDGE